MQQMLQDLTAALHSLEPATSSSSSSEQRAAGEVSAGGDASLQAVLQHHGLGAAQLQGVSGLLQVGLTTAPQQLARPACQRKLVTVW
jgi:hypothetical protein